MKSKGEDDEEERMEDHSGNCSVSLCGLPLFLLVKAISIPEKKADSNSITTIRTTVVSIAFSF